VEIIQYQKKAVQSGKMVELYEYARPIFRGLKSRLGGGGGDREPKARTMQSAMRTRKNIRQHVNCNPTMDKFLTLTFAENVVDVETANYEFKKFRQKLERHIGRKFKYLGVIEFQKRGAVHYHLMMDIPFIEWQKLSEIWGQGRIQIERIRKPNRAGVYMAKTTGYLMKGVEDLRLYGRKIFFYSYTLLDKITEWTDNFIKEFQDLVDTCKILVYEKRFFVVGHGMIKYSLYAT